MIINETFAPALVSGARIKVIWVGGAGNNAIDRMITEWLEWAEFIAVNTDAQALGKSLAEKKINIWLNITRGLWAGSNPDVWRKAAEEDIETIKGLLFDTDMVFITTGMGWGTGTGAAPVIAEIAKSLHILTIWVVTKPFSFEGRQRQTMAEDGIERLKQHVDSLIIIPNDKVFSTIDRKTTFQQAFTKIDSVLMQGIQGITDLIQKPGMINVDFADVKNFMEDSGTAMIGIGYGAGENRATDAARKAIESPLLESQLDRAKSIIFAVTGGQDLTPMEVKEAADIVEDIIDASVVKFKWWMSIDDSYDGEVKVTIIATGFQEASNDPIIQKSKRDELGRVRINERPVTKESFGSSTNRIDPKNNNVLDDEDEFDRETPPVLDKFRSSKVGG